MELLSSLVEQGIELWYEGDRLRFRAPKGAMTAEQRTELSTRKGEVLARLRADAARKSGTHPQSFSQRSLWFLHQQAPLSTAYHVNMSVRVRSAIDTGALRNALQALMDRHSILRTTYGVSNGEPCQHVAGFAEATLDLHDVAGVDDAELRARVEADYKRPFDLEQGPALRTSLFSRADDAHVLLLTVHHIAADGWSLLLLFQELFKLYAEGCGGPAAGLARPELQYTEYVAWQEQMLAGPEGERLWSYWRGKLAAPRAVLDLPSDRSRPQTKSFHGASIPMALDAALTTRLRQLARQEGTTMFVVLLASFQAFLARLSGAEDLIVGTPTFARSRPEFLSVVGDFVNSVALRGRLTPGMSFRELIVQLRTTVLEALDAQEYPFPLLVQKLQPERDPSRSPLFDTFFALQRFDQFRELEELLIGVESEHEVELGGLRVAPFPLAQQEGQFDLALQMAERSDALFAVFKYSSDLFDEATVRRLAAHYRILLDGLVGDPTAAVDALALFDADDAAQLRRISSGAAHAYPKDASYSVLFEAQAAHKPQAIAVSHRGENLTYAELNQRANRLAHRLIAMGARRGALVGVCLQRSLDLVVALLAVQKTGAAYVPLDPDFPADRLAFMLADSGAGVLVTADGAAAAIALPGGVQVLDLRQQAQAITQADAVNPATSAQANDAAYVIYTSGSTGKPKGVAVPHGALVNFLTSMAKEPGLIETDTLAAVTTFSFDIAGLEFYLPWLVGARVELVGRDEAADGAALASRIEASGATVLQATPATWRLLVEAGLRAPSGFRGFCGGEALPRDLAQALLDRGVELWNLYGPTETTVWSTAGRVKPGSGSVSIGRPIANTLIHVVDKNGHLVPVGVAGEIWIGGDGVALGYHRRPELTAEKFIRDPFGGTATGRLYRTGDLGRWRADGELEHLGRIDSQVKLRGYRIELEEIEAVLAEMPQVLQAVVNPWEAAAGDTRLVAYVVLRQGASLPLVAMREYLGRKLPIYMVPTQIVPVTAVPLTPNGKIDRRALPRPQADIRALAEEREPAQTPTELALEEIWCEILGVKDVARGDDFFALGGHSLLATQVVSRVREALQLEVPVRVLFEAPELAGFAQRVDAGLARERNGTPLPSIEIQDLQGPTPLSFSQERMWLIQSLDPGSLAYNLPVAFRMRGDLDEPALSEAVDELRRRHEVLRTTYRLADGVLAQEVHPWSSQPLAAVDLRSYGADAPAQAMRLATAEACTPFDLAQGPVFRSVLFRFGDGDYLLVLNLHHIACDQWSMGLLGRELATLYNQLHTDRKATLASPAIRYRDFAVWQRQWLQGEELERQMTYWLARLANLTPLELPTDRPRPQVQSFNGQALVAALPSGLVERLHEAARTEGGTLFMLMYAAFAALLHRLTGQNDIAVGVPIANRNQRAVEGLIGNFVNTLVMRSDLSGTPSFRELVHRARGAALDAYAHQDVPFEQIVERLGRRDTSRAPLVQVVFNVQNAPVHGMHFEGLEWELASLERGAAQLDLSFVVDTQVSRSLTVEYNSDLFDRETVERMMGQYFELLANALARPDEKLCSLGLLPAQQRDELLRWNQSTAVDYPADTVFSRLFEAQVSSAPEATAVSFEGAGLSYGELNSRANQLATHLRTLGVGPGVLVGLCMERGLMLAIALMGIQKAGGAYVPLDPGFPADRLSYMLEDSGAAVLVTAGDAASSIDTPQGVQVLDLDAQPAALFTLNTGNLDSAASPGDTAYVIYTSGSTGRPKGVAISHGALVNFLASMRRVPGLSSNDVLAAVTTISFDIAGLELYLPWLVGARVELVARETAIDGVELASVLKASRATVLQATPATWRLLIEADWRPEPEFRALCGGEGLPRDLADALLARVDQLWNLYGPTETTIWSTVERVLPGPQAISVGRPIANTQIYIVDAYGEQVPVGIPGEIWIGGAGVALGYHRRPELTTERFVRDKFSGQAGAMLYRTGDLGRFRADGRIEHLGRLDHQVKIRGFRIELGEIETVLSAHEAVRQCVVIAREAAPGDLRLVAYLVYKPGEDLTVSDVRRFLRRDLPDYMVPSVVTAVEAIPLTPNGKVDRAALPDPFKNVVQADHVFVPPADGVEQAMADIWRDVLQVPRVGAEDNFFELGGHSLLSLRVTAAVEKRLGWRMDARTLFFQNLRQVVATAAAVNARGAA